MDGAWVDKLERRFGFLAAPGLPTFLVGMSAAVGLLRELKPEFTALLTLDPAGLAQGQVWRAVSFLIVPPPLSPLFLVLWLWFVHVMLSSLEAAWGEFKLTVFFLIGVLATGAGAIAVGAPFESMYLITALFLGYARLLPDREMLVMFVLPVKLRWLAAFAALWTALDFVLGPGGRRVEIAASLLPYFAFFGAGHWQDARFAWRRWRNGLP